MNITKEQMNELYETIGVAVSALDALKPLKLEDDFQDFVAMTHRNLQRSLKLLDSIIYPDGSDALRPLSEGSEKHTGYLE